MSLSETCKFMLSCKSWWNLQVLTSRFDKPNKGAYQCYNNIFTCFFLILKNVKEKKERKDINVLDDKKQSMGFVDTIMLQKPVQSLVGSI